MEDKKETIEDKFEDRDLDKELENIPDNDECFVATVVYGDQFKPEVNTLRKFRDEVLANYSVGKSFIDFYYGGAGKKTAYFIKNNLPSTIPVIRKGLDVVVNTYSKHKNNQKN